MFIYLKGFPDSSVGKESTCNTGEPGSIPGLGRSPGEGIGYPLQYSWASLVAQLVKNPPAMWETWVRFLGWEDPLEKGKATHSSILAWRIPWTIQRHNWVTFTFRQSEANGTLVPTGTQIKNGKGDSTKSWAGGKMQSLKICSNIPIWKHPTSLEGHLMTLLSPNLRHSMEQGEKPTCQGPEVPPLPHGSHSIMALCHDIMASP